MLLSLSDEPQNEYKATASPYIQRVKPFEFPIPNLPISSTKKHDLHSEPSDRAAELVSALSSRLDVDGCPAGSFMKLVVCLVTFFDGVCDLCEVLSSISG